MCSPKIGQSVDPLFRTDTFNFFSSHKSKRNGLCSNLIFGRTRLPAVRKLLFFIGLTLVIGLFATYQGQRMAHQIEQHSAEQIQADILALDESIQAQLKEINESDIGLQSLCDKWEKKGVGFVIYNENQVADWTTSGIPFEVEFDSRQPPKQGIINLKNSWYLCRSIREWRPTAGGLRAAPYQLRF
jgi:hypothetical protein